MPSFTGLVKLASGIMIIPLSNERRLTRKTDPKKLRRHWDALGSRFRESCWLLLGFTKFPRTGKVVWRNARARIGSRRNSADIGMHFATTWKRVLLAVINFLLGPHQIQVNSMEADGFTSKDGETRHVR